MPTPARAASVACPARCPGHAPGCEGGDGVGKGVWAVGDTDALATSVLVGVGPANSQEQPARLGLNVSECERGQLGTPQSRGEPEQDDRRFTSALGGVCR